LTLADVVARLEQTTPPLVVRHRLSSRGAGPALFSLLDTDGDGRLSKGELDSAESSLRCRDFNDDELITADELILGPGRASDSGSAIADSIDGPVVAVTAATTPERLVDILLLRYDRNRDGKLSFGGSPPEIRSPTGAFARFDANHDEALDRTELAALLASPPDIEISFFFGRQASASRPADRTKPEAATAYRLRRKLDGGYRLTVAENEIDFRRNNRDPAQPDLMPQLSDFDQNKNGVLEGDELTAAGLAPILSLVDTNNDGKVNTEEFDAYHEWQGEIAGAQLVLEATDEGQDLFSLLDRNGDGFLSPRELKTAADILATEDHDHHGCISSADIPYHIMLELSRGGPAAKANAAVPAGASVRRPRPAKTTDQPPEWFTKMDRNGDGEISPAEFLGSREQFDKLDSNHDGLIDAAEAIASGKP
jgi:Ca2+-binding EF-hand superfamily protein